MDIVRENRQRGLSKEAIEEKTNEIYSYASSSAKDRVKMSFLLGRIASAENLKATEAEIQQRILQLAKQNQMAPDKFAKQLKEREGGLNEIENQIVSEKVIDFLQLHAKVEEDASAG
jgi:FKBP-type peptidyl-prolyl cis-trans isomerase (trigger factor)